MLNEPFSLENAMNLDYRILSIVIVLLLLTLMFIVLGIGRFLRGRLLTASIQSLSSVILFIFSLSLLSIAMNLYSYERLTYEQPIAELTFNQVDKQLFQVEISYQNDNETDIFIINGDEWQIDARVIKWQGWVQLLGLNAQYRLERISGRYTDIEEERLKTRSVYSLGPRDEIDYWKLINDYKKWLRWVDAYYGSATYLPMADDATYEISLTQTGLVARPLDAKAEKIIKLW